MKTLTMTALILIASCVAYADTAEFIEVVSTGATVTLTSSYAHFSIATSNDIKVRFVAPEHNNDGSLRRLILSPAGDASIADGSGARPDAADTTFTVFAANAENIFNDITAKKLVFTGSGTVTIRAKK